MASNEKIKQILSNKKAKKVLKCGILFMVLLILTVFGIDMYVKIFTHKDIVPQEYYGVKISDVDCIIVLGAGVRDGGKPSPMLKDRLTTCTELYNNSPTKILMSGDHGREEYNEVKVMKDYVVERGIPSEDVFEDHAGFSTYDTMYRAKEVFKAKRVIIVTQEYHLYRAIYVAKQLGLKAYGITADKRDYHGQILRDIREIFARDKDAVKCIFKPKSTYVGEEIPISGNGNVTNDENE